MDSKELGSLIFHQEKLMEDFTGRYYAQVFKQYTEKAEPIFSKLSDALSQDPQQGDILARDLVEEIWNTWKAKKPKAKDPTYLPDKMVLISYFLPALMESTLPYTTNFAEAVQNQWNSQHPESSFQMMPLDEIQQGFKRKLCFITTAVCEYYGEADDCSELTAFRQFRDTYLAQQEGGQKLIEEYYDIAPAIVFAIHQSGREDDVYPQLQQKYLLPCLEDIQRGEYLTCQNRYMAMVEECKKSFLVKS